MAYETVDHLLNSRRSSCLLSETNPLTQQYCQQSRNAPAYSLDEQVIEHLHCSDDLSQRGRSTKVECSRRIDSQATCCPMSVVCHHIGLDPY